MPELPEVETSRRGIAPHITGKRLTDVIIRQPSLRWPIPIEQCQALVGEKLVKVHRRAKYILLNFESGTLLLHLGMSGSLRVLDPTVEPVKHDHVDLIFAGQAMLRLNDPRRFGALLWAGREPYKHVLLTSLGPEPDDPAFNTDYCYQKSRGKRQAIKQWIMDGHVVVGVGNIYANESLFKAGIHPSRQAGKISRARFERLVSAIKSVISHAIEQGGTSLRDFTQADGKPGYFKQELTVYGRGDEPCVQCNTPLKATRHGQRATVYCAQCQT